MKITKHHKHDSQSKLPSQEKNTKLPAERHRKYRYDALRSLWAKIMLIHEFKQALMKPNYSSGENTMAYYTLKSIGKSTDYMTILKETEDGFVVRIVRDKDGYDDITTDFISHSLFDSCIRTGYLTKIEDPSESKIAVNA